MTTFAAAFKKIVMPLLRKSARTQGYFLALEIRTFPQAYDTVFHLASQRGALHLPDDILSDLQSWIAEQIINYCLEAEPSVEETRQVADRVARDPALIAALKYIETQEASMG